MTSSTAICNLCIFILLFLLQPSLTLQQNITLNASLVADGKSPPWISPSEDFAFGFQKLPNTDLFLLAIWFHQIPNKTIIWHANGDNPSQEGSKLQLTSDGLRLTNPGGQVTWEQLTNETVSYAAMLDTGNFILASYNNNNNAVHLWESFKNPTDTILPSQVLDSDTNLFSRLTKTNFSRGRFELYILDGHLNLRPVAWPSTWAYSAYYSNSESGNHLVFNESSASIHLKESNGSIVQIPWKTIATNPGEDYYHRATLNYDGVFTEYAHPKSPAGDQSWAIVKYIPENFCDVIFDDSGTGACGYNSYCQMVTGRPNCTCLPGYLLIEQNNPFGGCIPNFPQGYGIDDASDDLYELKVLDNVNLPKGDYERLEQYTEEQCRISCLLDRLCAAAIYSNSNCWKKKSPLANGRLEIGPKALIKVRKDGTSDILTLEKKKEHDRSILLGSLCSSLVVNALLLIIVPLVMFLKLNRKSNKVIKVSTFLETQMHMFRYKELQEATGNFKEEIGRGSSGIVYKGTLKLASNDMNIVAVKKLDKLSQEAEKEFKTELKAIGKTCHKNLVRLVGFCEEGIHRLLVYEYMTNGTLANFLLGLPKPGWNMRAKIALEIARGLVYLHQDCEVPIIHCDIKPENILLDEAFTARISDFGLVKLLQYNQSRTLTNIRGTRGYVAPEWFRNVAVTAKVDVYSYGVVLLEIICCRKNVSKVENEEGILTEWVYDCFMSGRIDEVIEFDKEAAADKDRLNSWVSIALWCIQEDPSKRPSMKMVLQMLEGVVEVPLPPMQSFSSTF